MAAFSLVQRPRMRPEKWQAASVGPSPVLARPAEAKTLAGRCKAYVWPCLLCSLDQAVSCGCIKLNISDTFF